jgi:dihydroorotase
MELYATAFEQAGALDKLEAFASLNGPNFYGLPVNEGTITLKREAWTIPPTLALGDQQVVPLDAGGQIGWKML